MRNKIGLNVLRLVAVIALVGACGGVGIAEETEEWIADDIFKITSEYGSTIWILDDGTSTMRGLFLPLLETVNRDGFQEVAQALVDDYLGEAYQFGNSDYKINWIQVVAEYGDEMLLLDQKFGENTILLSIPSLLVEGYNGISIEQQPEGWIADSVLISRSDYTSYVYFFDRDTATVRELQFFFDDADSVDTFKVEAQSSIDFSFGDDWFTNYTIDLVQIAAEYDDEILVLSQKRGDDAVFLPIPSLLEVEYNKTGSEEKIEQITDNNRTVKPWEVMECLKNYFPNFC